jgi:hypothetical protein
MREFAPIGTRFAQVPPRGIVFHTEGGEEGSLAIHFESPREQGRESST